MAGFVQISDSYIIYLNDPGCLFGKHRQFEYVGPICRALTIVGTHGTHSVHATFKAEFIGNKLVLVSVWRFKKGFKPVRFISQFGCKYPVLPNCN
jgi:hypothetical protein